jgi:hypothetical protein
MRTRCAPRRLPRRGCSLIPNRRLARAIELELRAISHFSLSSAVLFELVRFCAPFAQLVVSSAQPISYITLRCFPTQMNRWACPADPQAFD